jgi:tetratricopeptide (TPR) repeat protein
MEGADAEGLEREIRDTRIWQASAAMQVGDTLGYMGNTREALNWIHRSLAQRRALNIQAHEAYSLASMGRLQREINQLTEARESFSQALDRWQELNSQIDVLFIQVQLGHIDALQGRLDDADRLYDEAAKACESYGLYDLLADLRAKQGQSRLQRARRTENETERLRLLDEAEGFLREAIDLAQGTNQPLYEAISLAALARVDEMRERFDRIPEWASRLRAFSAEQYEFGPAFADLEQVLGNIAFREARRDDGEYDAALFDRTVDHYLQMYLYLARHSRLRYRERREFLREWLPALPPAWRERAGRRLITGWRAEPCDPHAEPGDPRGEPGCMAREFSGLIRDVEFHCDM